jgi:hypothetical protein
MVVTRSIYKREDTSWETRSGWEDNIKMSVNIMGDAEPSDIFQNALMPGGVGVGVGVRCRVCSSRNR